MIQIILGLIFIKCLPSYRMRIAMKNFYGNAESRRQHCIKVVGETARLLGELLEKEAEIMAAKEAEKKDK